MTRSRPFTRHFTQKFKPRPRAVQPWVQRIDTRTNVRPPDTEKSDE